MQEIRQGSSLRLLTPKCERESLGVTCTVYTSSAQHRYVHTHSYIEETIRVTLKKMTISWQTILPRFRRDILVKTSDKGKKKGFDKHTGAAPHDTSN